MNREDVIPTGFYNGKPIEIGDRFIDSGGYVVAHIYSLNGCFPNGKLETTALLEYITDINFGECYCSDSGSYICDNCELRYDLEKAHDVPIPF